MSFTFPRLSAGVYEVQDNTNLMTGSNPNTIGFIRKSNASKWLIVDVLDNPKHVSKTLKDAKFAIENGFVKFDDEGVDNTPKSDYNHSVRDEDDKVVNTLELQKQMLASMKTYVIDSSGNFEEVKEPTLEPIEF